MRTKLRNILAVLGIGLLLLPAVTLAHHMGQGFGSAPDVVDDYAHGANAQSDNQSGYSVDMGPQNSADGNGMANAMGGQDGDGDGGPGGGDGGPGGGDGGAGGSDSGSGGDSDSGSDGGNGSGSGEGSGRN